MKFIIYLCFLLCIAMSAAGGTLTRGLSEQFGHIENEALLPVIIALKNRVNVADLDERLAPRKLALSDMHHHIIDSLRARSAEASVDVLSALTKLESAGSVSDVKSFWISNLITAYMTQAAAETIAERADVAEIGLDESIALRAPRLTDQHALGSKTVLQSMRAQEAWRSGWRGDSMIVCVIADGANELHPAISTQWNGNDLLREQAIYPADETPLSGCGDAGMAMLGAMIGNDELGIAPNAKWISASIFCEEQTRLSDWIGAMQWAMDPDTDSRTFHDVPAVICLAFSLNETCMLSAPSAIWEVTDNVEFAGPLCIFAASDQTERNSITLPEARTTPYLGHFSVGSVHTDNAIPVVASFSGRGPSLCDNKTVKPELTAPGVAIRTATRESFAAVSGTAISAAYVSGAIALMRQANPNLSAHTAKQILQLTARDLGASGEDNDYGWGLLDVAAATKMASQSASSGSITGKARYGGKGIGGARIILFQESGGFTTTTRGNGSFRFPQLPSTQAYKLFALRFGYKIFELKDSVRVEKGKNKDITIDLRRGFFDDAEFDQGFSTGVSDDDATGGMWIRAIPVGSREGSYTVQPFEDSDDDGRYCFVTGNASSAEEPSGTADVDGGKTTLRSPVFDLTEIENPVLTFSYYYSNDRGGQRGGDFFRAQISNDDGKTWINLIQTSASTDGWKEITVQLNDFVVPTATMLLQFIADDYAPPSLVEAAVDKISITGEPGAPEPPRELILDVQFDQVVLYWRPSDGATSYNVYLSPVPGDVIKPENLYTITPDTTLSVPLSSIPFDQFYFKVTAVR